MMGRGINEREKTMSENKNQSAGFIERAEEKEQGRYCRLLAHFEALKNANNDALAMILAGNNAQAVKDLQRGNRISAGVSK